MSEAKAKTRAKAKQQSPSYVCGKKGRFARDCFVKKPPRQNIKEVEGAKVDADPAEEFVFTIGKHSQRCNLGPQWLRKSEKTEWR